ncbi:MAG: hypothetical protein ABIT37_00505 [Luteolibacter sp.]
MEDDLNNPLTNPAHAWLRGIMWTLPTGFIWMSAFGVNYLASFFGMNSGLSTCIWMLLNIGFVIGAGWYDSLLSSHARMSPGVSYLWIIQFFLHQLYLMPLITFVLMVAGCAVIG